MHVIAARKAALPERSLVEVQDQRPVPSKGALITWGTSLPGRRKNADQAGRRRHRGGALPVLVDLVEVETQAAAGRRPAARCLSPSTAPGAL